MTPFTLRIPGLPPSTNNAFASVGNRRVLSKDAKSFKDLVRWTILADRHNPKPKFKGPVEVSLTFYSQKWLTSAGKPRRIDLGNLEKLACDAVFEALGLDDSSIWKLTLRKLDGPEESVIRITPLDGAP